MSYIESAIITRLYYIGCRQEYFHTLRKSLASEVVIFSCKDTLDGLIDQRDTFDIIVLEVDDLAQGVKDLLSLRSDNTTDHKLTLCLVGDGLSATEKMHLLDEGASNILSHSEFENAGLVHVQSFIKMHSLLYQHQNTISGLNRRLSTNYLLLDAKNSCLQSISSSLNKVASETKEQPELNKTLVSLMKEIQENVQNESHLDLFKLHFEEVHPSFFQRLLEINPSLSANNLKLAAHIKMGFQNNEIAFISHTTIASVKKSVQRLKQKLNIPPEESIRDFIHSY